MFVASSKCVLLQEKTDISVKPRHQVRRAASKEALKQMQMLLEDEDDTVEVPDDDVSDGSCLYLYVNKYNMLNVMFTVCL